MEEIEKILPDEIKSQVVDYFNKIKDEHNSAIKELEESLEKTHYSRGRKDAYLNIEDSVSELLGLSKLDEKQKASDFVKQAINNKIAIERESLKKQIGTGDSAATLQKIEVLQSELEKYKQKETEAEKQKELQAKIEVLKKGMPKFALDESIIKPHLDAIYKSILESDEPIHEIDGKIFVGKNNIVDLLEKNSIFTDVLKKHITTNNIDAKGLDINNRNQYTSYEGISRDAKTKKGIEQSTFIHNSVVDLLISQGLKRHSSEFKTKYTETIKEIHKNIKI